MEARLADIVRSLKGRDAGELLIVVEEDGDFVLLANGRGRRAQHPKRKKRKHTQYVGSTDAFTHERLQANGRLTNNEIRRAITLWQEQQAQMEEESPVWQKTTSSN